MTSSHIIAAEVRHQQKTLRKERASVCERQNVNEKEKERNPTDREREREGEKARKIFNRDSTLKLVF